MSKTSKNKLLHRKLYAAVAVVLPAGAMAATAILPADITHGPTISQLTGKAAIVGIVAPNDQGVSHNKFAQFNVDTQGVVLNNSATGVTSKLAGAIAGNANLANGAAKVIITEVTGNTASQLNGALEIAGSKAALIMANPNGINANGASFINASRVTLATGVPKLDAAGNVASIDVAKGVINVTGTGADISGVEMADLMARSIVLNAELKADRLRVITGPNKVAYAAADSVGAIAATAITGEGAAPDLALDVAALGGMHADAIRMIGTEKGVGVNVAGTIAAKTSTDLASGGIVNIVSAGAVKSGGSVNLTAGTHVFNAGTISADTGDVKLASQMANYSATLDSKGGSILASKGAVSFEGFGHKRTGQLTSSNFNLASDDNGNSISANSSINDGNGAVAKPPVQTVPSEQPATNPPVTTPPVTEQPATNPPVTTPPTTEQPATKPPVTTPPVTEQPATNPPVTTPPVTEQPATNPPVTTPPVAEQPATNPPVTTPPVAEQPATNPPVTTPPVAEQPATNPPVTTPPVAEQPATPPVTTPPVAEQPATNPPVTTPPVAQQPQPSREEAANAFVQQLLNSIFSQLSYGFSPWGSPSYGYGHVQWNRPSYGYSAYSPYGYSPWMPTYFQPRPVFSRRPMAAYGFNRPSWRY